MTSPQPNTHEQAPDEASPWKRLVGVVVVCAVAGVAAMALLSSVLASVEWPTFVSETWLERMRTEQRPEPGPMPEIDGTMVQPVASPVEPEPDEPSPAPPSSGESVQPKSNPAEQPASNDPKPPRDEDSASKQAQKRAEPADDGPTDVTYKVDRRAVAGLIKKPTDLGKHGRFVPNTVDGKRRGFKFVDVATGGLFDRLGVREGDVVLEVNGRALTTQTQLIEDIETLKSAHVYVVRIQRGDATRIHRYDAGPPLRRKASGKASQ